jgi:hypothetical protein
MNLRVGSICGGAWQKARLVDVSDRIAPEPEHGIGTIGISASQDCCR